MFLAGSVTVCTKRKAEGRIAACVGIKATVSELSYRPKAGIMPKKITLYFIELAKFISPTF
jgi:hypothetical protein